MSNDVFVYQFQQSRFIKHRLLKLTAQHNKSLHLTARRLPLINICWCFPRCVLLAVGR